MKSIRSVLVISSFAMLAACGGGATPAANAPSSGQVSIGPSGAASPSRTSPAGAKGLDVLPAEVSLGPFVPVFEHMQRRSGWNAFTAQPLELDTDHVALLSFGRRVIVSGQTARIIDRAENPRFEEVAVVPESSGGGYLFMADSGVSYAKTFDGEPMAFRTKKELGGAGIFFGPRTVLFIDNSMGRSDDQDTDPEAYTYVSLLDGRELPFPLMNVSALVGTLDGRTAAVSKDGEIYYSGKIEEGFRLVNVPTTRQLSVEGSEIQVYDEMGPYVLDPSLAREAMKAPSASTAAAQWQNMLPPKGASHALRGRKLDENLIVNNGGSELRVSDRLGNDTGQTFKVVPGTQRYCEFLSSDGPLLMSCRGGDGKGDVKMSIHLFDAEKKTGKLDRALSGINPQMNGMLTIQTTQSGQPAFFSKCSGQMDGSTACVRSKEGTYREVDLRRGLIATGLLDPSQSALTRPYFAYQTPLAPSDTGTAAILAMKDKNGILVLSDGRTRTFELKPLPRMVRSLLGGHYGGGREGDTTWLVGDKVIGFHASHGGYGRAYRRMGMSFKKAKGGFSQALVFSIPLQGEITASVFDGFLGRAGGRILRISPDGLGMQESNDLGQTFKTVQAPPGLALDPKSYEPYGNSEFCAETACVIGPWVRLGWGK
jgi:hypothetical protein